MSNNPFQKALPIWGQSSSEPNQYVAFRDAFTLSALPTVAFLRIRVENRYSAELNGRWLAAQQYADFTEHPVYEEIPLDSALFVIGENRFSLLGYCQNEDSLTYRRGEPSAQYELLCDGDVVLASGAQTLCTEQTGFVSGAGVEKLTGQLSYSFRFDEEALERGERMYAPATVLRQNDAEYRIRPIPPLRVGAPQTATVVAQGSFLQSDEEQSGMRMYRAGLRHADYRDIASCKSRTLPSEEGITFFSNEDDGIFAVLDLGKESVGYLTLDLETDGACRIDGGIGEHLEDLRVRTYVGHRNFAFSVNKKAGRLRLEWPIKRFGCRYLQLHIEAPRVTLYSATLRPTDYPVTANRMPQGLNGLQQRIYEISVETLRCCMHEHYEDCPWREQALYAMDSRNQMLFGYLAFGETDMPRESLRLLAQGQREEGVLELTAPGRTGTGACIPSFSLIWVLALQEYVEETGDVAFAREMEPTMQGIFSFFDAWRQGALVCLPVGYWNFYEWAPNLDGYDSAELKAAREGKADAPLNCFYALALRAAASLEQCMGHTEKADAYLSQLSALKEQFRRSFYSEEHRAFCLGHGAEGDEVCFPELVQSLALLAELFESKEQEASVCRRLLDGAFSPAVTLSHRAFFYQALLRDSRLNDEVLADVEKHWAPMVYAGATTFWETEDGACAFHDAGSLCHGWSAAPIYVYHRLFGRFR